MNKIGLISKIALLVAPLALVNCGSGVVNTAAADEQQILPKPPEPPPSPKPVEPKPAPTPRDTGDPPPPNAPPR